MLKRQSRRGDPTAALLSSQQIQQLMGLPNTSQAISIGTKIIIWPWTFMVCSCTVFPLFNWTGTIFGVFASAVIGTSNAAARRKESERFKNRIGYLPLVTIARYLYEMITRKSRRRPDLSLAYHGAVISSQSHRLMRPLPHIDLSQDKESCFVTNRRFPAP
jgi:hypothetical protein